MTESFATERSPAESLGLQDRECDPPTAWTDSDYPRETTLGYERPIRERIERRGLGPRR
jgi:hypothetical protein